MGVAGPLPEGIVGFVLGRSLLSWKKKKERKKRNFGGAWCSRFWLYWKIKVLTSPPTKTVQINKGQKITQLLLLPYYQTGKNLTSQARSHRTFGSSDLAFWVQEITAPRPLKDLLIQGNKMFCGSYLEKSSFFFSDNKVKAKAMLLFDLY